MPRQPIRPGATTISAPDVVTVKQWCDILGRIRFASLSKQTRKGRSPMTIKAVATRMALYADFATGDRIWVGLARLAVVLECNYDTVKDVVGLLRCLGLLRLVKTANRPGDCNEYQLTLPEDLVDHDELEVWDPDRLDVVVAHLSLSKRGKYRPPADPCKEDLRGARHPAGDGEAHRPAGSDAPRRSVDNPGLRGVSQPADPPPDEAPAGCFTPPDEAPAGCLTPDLRVVTHPATYHVPTTGSTYQDQLKVVDQLTVVGAHEPNTKPIPLFGGRRLGTVPRPQRPESPDDPPDVQRERAHRGRALVDRVLAAKALGEPNPLTLVPEHLAPVLPFRRPA